MSGREHGGPVGPGQGYTVGEHGPETLVVGEGFSPELMDAIRAGRAEIRIAMTDLKRVMRNSRRRELYARKRAKAG